MREGLEELTDKVQIHMLTADIFGSARAELEGAPSKLSIPPEKNQDVGKLEYVKGLGSEKTVCIGNGRNERLMLREAALGIAVVLQEGAAGEAILAADVVIIDILSALELLRTPSRLVANLRS